MAPGPDWLPAIDTEAAADAIGDGIQALVDSGILQTTAGVATADPTVLVGGAVVGTLAKTELVEYSRIADRRLTQYIEETDEDEHAYRVKLAKGINHFLPEGFGDAAIDAARGNPDDLREVMEEYYAGEKHDELDNAVQRILKGDIENLGTELCEAFDTDDVYEAQALFLDFRDLIESRQVQETLETVLDIEGRFADLEEELGETRKELRANFRALVRRDLRDEGFVYVAPVEFDREITDSEAAWRAGFDLVHVRQGFAAPRAGIHGDRTVREELLSTLRDGDDQLIVGRAGSGKSTVCKSVACAWYDDPDTGTVFYRESGKGRPFTSSGSLVKAVRESDGHTLVAVEDAARDETEAVYEAMADLRGDRVSFLLDARRGDVERFGEPGQLETGAQGKVAEAYGRISRYSLDEQLSEAEIRAVFDRFEATTGREVGAPPDRIRNELQQGGDIGQMLFLSYYLPVGGGGGGLLRDVANKYQTITGTADGREHWTDVTEFDADLRQDVALTTALLVATGVGNHDELVHALCEKHGRDGAVHDEITEIRTALEGWFVYPTDDPDAEVPATTHELWATLYLQQEAEAFVENQEQREREFGTPDPNRFHTCLTALYAVVDDSCREYLRGGYPDSTVLERIEDDPAAFGERLAVDILDLGRDRPALTPLFEFGTDLEMPVPSNCDRDAVSRIETRKGHVCLDRGAYDQARVHHRRSLDLARELGDRQTEAHSLNNLGLVARNQGDYDDAREYHHQSLDIKRELGDRQGEANSLGNLGLVAQSQGDYDDAREYHQQSLDLARELGDRQTEAQSLTGLGAVAQSQGDYDDAREYFRRANEQFREIGSFRNALTTFEKLVDVCEEMDDTEAAIEWCERARDWAGSVDRIDLSDTAAEFERRRLRLDVSEEATWELYLNGVYHVYSGDDEAAFRLLEEVWDRRETFGADTDVSPVIVSAGVVLAAYARLFDDEAFPYDAGEMLNAIDEEQELTLGAGVLFERLAEGETETTPDELEATADEQDSEFAQLDLLAAARLLKALDAE